MPCRVRKGQTCFVGWLGNIMFGSKSMSILSVVIRRECLFDKYVRSMSCDSASYDRRVCILRVWIWRLHIILQLRCPFCTLLSCPPPHPCMRGQALGLYMYKYYGSHTVWCIFCFPNMCHTSKLRSLNVVSNKRSTKGLSS